MYSVRLRSGARHGETPRIGGNPKNQPISELDIFSKRQALSRAVVVNSNISRGKYLAREGPGSRLGIPRDRLCRSNGERLEPELSQTSQKSMRRCHPPFFLFHYPLLFIPLPPNKDTSYGLPSLLVRVAIYATGQ